MAHGVGQGLSTLAWPLAGLCELVPDAPVSAGWVVTHVPRPREGYVVSSLAEGLRVLLMTEQRLHPEGES